MKRAVTLLTTLMVFLIAAGSAAADWRDAGIQEQGEGFTDIHVFENVSDEGKIVERIFVPEEVGLGGILAAKIYYAKMSNGQDSALIWKLFVVGIAPNGVELSSCYGGPTRNYGIC